MMKKVLLVVLIGMLLMMPFVVAKATYPSLTKMHESTQVVKETKSTSNVQQRTHSSGGSLFTKYGWDGTKCVKRDLVGNKHAVVDWNTRRVIGWKVRIIDGERALAWNDEIMKPSTDFYGCTEGVVEIDPLPITWWIHR